MPCKIIVDNFHSNNTIVHYDWPSDADPKTVCGSATVAVWHVNPLNKSVVSEAIKEVVKEAKNTYETIKKAKNAHNKNNKK